MCAVIDQVYGYLALNNLIYECVTCYVTYLVWQPVRDTLRISHSIYNDLCSPSRIQAIYLFNLFYKTIKLNSRN